MIPVFDTNVLIDYLLGHEPAKLELSRHDGAVISLVSWMEVMVGATDEAEERTLRAFLSRFDVSAVDAAVAESAVRLRRRHRLRLPDAIIWATAKARQTVLVTRDTRDFPPDEPDIRVPYELG